MNIKFDYVASNIQVYKPQFQVIDYGIYKDYICCKYVKDKNYEPIEKKKSEHEEVQRIVQSRAKQKIKELALCNNFEYFYTQTCNSERDNLDLFVEKIQKRFKAYKRKNKNFIYLIIYEKHKDGINYHLHGLVGGLGDDVYVNDNGFLSLGDLEDIGFNSLSKIKDKIKVSHYITKYITKGISKTSKGQAYFHSNGLEFAKRTVLDDMCCDNLDKVFENDFIVLYREKEL